MGSSAQCICTRRLWSLLHLRISDSRVGHAPRSGRLRHDSPATPWSVGGAAGGTELFRLSGSHQREVRLVGEARTVTGTTIPVGIDVRDAFGNALAAPTSALAATVRPRELAEQDAWLLATQAGQEQHAVTTAALPGGGMATQFRSNVTGSFEVRCPVSSSVPRCAPECWRSWSNQAVLCSWR